MISSGLCPVAGEALSIVPDYLRSPPLVTPTIARDSSAAHLTSSMSAQIVDAPLALDPETGHEKRLPADQSSFEDEKKYDAPPADAFGDEAHAEVKYKTLKWW